MARQIICWNGKFFWEDAKPDFLDVEYLAYQHALHYASAAFEGARCYPNLAANDGSLNMVALDAHVDRLFRSMEFAWLKIPKNAGSVWEQFKKLYPELVDKYQSVLQPKLPQSTSKEFPFNAAQVKKQMMESVALNLHSGFITAEKGCYIRPLAFRSVNAQKGVGVFSLGHEVDFFVLVKTWGKYLGSHAFEKGAPVLVHEEGTVEYNRHHKLSCNYLTGQRLANYSSYNNFNEILLTDKSPDRNVLEGTGENLLFYLGNNQFITPRQEGQPILPGVTLHIMEQIIGALGGTVTYRDIPLKEIFDGKFLGAAMTGTAVEVTPISLVFDPKENRAVEIPVADTIKQLQQTYLQFVQGQAVDPRLKALQSKLIQSVRWDPRLHASLIP